MQCRWRSHRHTAVRDTINERHYTHEEPVKMHKDNAPRAVSILPELLKRPKARTQKTPRGPPQQKHPGGQRTKLKNPGGHAIRPLSICCHLTRQ